MPIGPLSKREKQILDILYRRGSASVAEVQEEMSGLSYSAVRGMLRVLHEKILVTASTDAPRHIFTPSTPREQAAKAAVESLVTTFFGNSIEQAVATLLDSSERNLTDEELGRIAKLIEKAREEQK